MATDHDNIDHDCWLCNPQQEAVEEPVVYVSSVGMQRTASFARKVPTQELEDQEQEGDHQEMNGWKERIAALRQKFQKKSTPRPSDDARRMRSDNVNETQYLRPGIAPGYDGVSDDSPQERFRKAMAQVQRASARSRVPVYNVEDTVPEPEPLGYPVYGGYAQNVPSPVPLGRSPLVNDISGTYTQNGRNRVGGSSSVDSLARRVGGMTMGSGGGSMGHPKGGFKAWNET